MPRRAGVEVRRAPRSGVGGAAAELDAGPLAAVARRPRARRGCSLPMRGAVRRAIVGYPGHFDMPARAGSPARGGRSSSTRSSRSPTRSSPTAAASATGSLAARVLHDSTGARSARRPRRRRHRVNARFLADLGGLPAGRVTRRFVGAEERLFTPALARGRSASVPLRRQADPAARARDDPRGGGARAGAPVPDRRQRPARRAARGAAAERRVDRWLEYEQLPRRYCGAGARSASSARPPKAARVIPNKAFQALACGTPLVTADTPAARELLADGESALLVPPATRPRSRQRCVGSPPTRRSRSDFGRAATRRTSGRRARPCSAGAGAR